MIGLAAVEDRILKACNKAGRDRSEVLLLAVTKTISLVTMQAAYDLGLRDFGENRVQELVRKAAELPEDICWHMIGHLQSNKAKQIATFVVLMHGLDSLDTAIELSKRAQVAGRTIDVLIEVNISGEPEKHGIEPDELDRFLESLLGTTENLRLRGLMGIATYADDPERVRPQFAGLRMLRDSVRTKYSLAEFDQLSMGMSGDFEVAIEEGSTIVRIGSALFGARA